MEHIRKAVELASGLGPGDLKPAREYRQPLTPPGSDDVDRGRPIDISHLERHRIIAHDDADARSKYFHILRTQILQTMDSRGWRTLAVTSPTPGCRATETAVNLAISVARQPDRSVVLVDLDLSASHVANCLGLECDGGVGSALVRSKPLSEALTPVTVGNYRLMVLPNEAPVANSSEWLASRSMASLLQELKATFRSSTLVVNIAPILPSDDAISVLPHIDCTLFVTAVGVTRLSEVKACDKYLKATEILRVLVHGVSSFG